MVKNLTWTTVNGAKSITVVWKDQFKLVAEAKKFHMVGRLGFEPSS